MELKHRPSMLAAIDPTFSQPKTPSPVAHSARSQDLLGAPPAKDVTYLSERARALLGPDAAALDAPIPRYSIRGAIFDAYA